MREIKPAISAFNRYNDIKFAAMENNMNEDMRWTTLKSELIVSRPPWLRVRCDEVRLPDGRINPEYYVLEYPDWVNVIAITEEGQFVMGRQYRYGLGCTCFEIPAGVIEPGEAPEEAAKRELEEETGYTGGEWKKLVTLSGNPSTTNNLTHCFLALGVKDEGKRHLDSTEDLVVKLLSREEVYALLVNDEIKQSLMAAPLWRYFALEEK